MNDRQKKVLLGIFLDREHYARQGRPNGRMDSQFATLWCKIQDCRNGLVQCNPGQWLGEAMTPSLYVMVSRTYEQLQRLGLVERVAGGYSPNRTTHLRLTEAGERAARELAAEQLAEHSSNACPSLSNWSKTNRDNVPGVLGPRAKKHR